MGDNKEYMTHPEELGCIHISEDVLASLAASAAVEVEGISGMMNLTAKKSNAKGVRLTVEDDGAGFLTGAPAGLGLRMVRATVREKLGGQLTIHTHGGGSQFVVTMKTE